MGFIDGIKRNRRIYENAFKKELPKAKRIEQLKNERAIREKARFDAKREAKLGKFGIARENFQHNIGNIRTKLEMLDKPEPRSRSSKRDDDIFSGGVLGAMQDELHGKKKKSRNIGLF